MNLLVAVVRHAGSCGRPRRRTVADGTRPDDYFADEGDPRVKDLPELVEGKAAA